MNNIYSYNSIQSNSYNLDLSLSLWDTYKNIGMAMGRELARPKDGVFIPASYSFVLLSSCPTAWRKKFRAPILACPLGPHKAPPHSVKFYFLLICPTITTILIKHVSLIKIYLKLQLHLSHKINLIFSKNWIILSKCLTRQYHNKKKNVIVLHITK